MTDKIFFDSNILIYLFDKTDSQKHEIAKKLVSDLTKDSFLYISSQVINEFINVTSKKIKNPITFEKQKDILLFLEDIFIITPITIHTTYTAIDIKLKYGFSFWDSLIITSALEKDCTLLYSEDMQHNQVVEKKMKILNPFKEKIS